MRSEDSRAGPNRLLDNTWHTERLSPMQVGHTSVADDAGAALEPLGAARPFRGTLDPDLPGDIFGR